MKTKRINYLIFITGLLLILNPLSMQAQYGKGKGHGQNGERGDRQKQHEKIESQKIAYITDKLDLSPEEAQKFWPVYNANRDKMKTEFKSFRENHDFTQEEIDAMTDSEAIAFLDEQMAHEQKLLDYKKDFNKQLEGILAPQKIVTLIGAEKEFKVELMRRASGRNGSPRK